MISYYKNTHSKQKLDFCDLKMPYINLGPPVKDYRYQATYIRCPEPSKKNFQLYTAWKFLDFSLLRANPTFLDPDSWPRFTWPSLTRILRIRSTGFYNHCSTIHSLFYILLIYVTFLQVRGKSPKILDCLHQQMVSQWCVFVRFCHTSWISYFFITTIYLVPQVLIFWIPKIGSYMPIL
jgi:hypothetical protein